VNDVQDGEWRSHLLPDRCTRATSDGRYRVLISAYACNPYRGSEEGVGWGWVKAIAQYHDLWVITAEFHRADIEKAVAADPEGLSRVRFSYVPHQWWHYHPSGTWKFIENSICKPIMNRAYRLWQYDAYRLGCALHQKIGFDLVHQITYVGFRFPGHLWALDIPFVWGPAAGLKNTPWQFLPHLGIRGCVYYAGRNVINAAHLRFLRDPKEAFRKAGRCGGIITATQEERQNIRKWYGQESEVICEIGPPATYTNSLSRRDNGDPLRLAWSGQHEPGKALPILLRALSRLPQEVNWQLEILGQGSCTTRWQRLARRYGVDGGCRWQGWLPRDQAVTVMQKAHVFVITSLKDLTSSVLIEALACGVPVVCPDHCGFHDAVTDACGIRLPVCSVRQLEADLADALVYLAGHEERRRQLAQGALQRVQAFSWEEKAQRVDSIYRRVMREYGALNA
jgi:glycosyltransferase involved in cell wall biosynthesis